MGCKRKCEGTVYGAGVIVSLRVWNWYHSFGEKEKYWIIQCCIGYFKELFIASIIQYMRDGS